jgi:hypothetical protein
MTFTDVKRQQVLFLLASSTEVRSWAEKTCRSFEHKAHTGKLVLHRGVVAAAHNRAGPEGLFQEMRMFLGPLLRVCRERGARRGTKRDGWQYKKRCSADRAGLTE